MSPLRSSVLLALSLAGCAATGSETPVTTTPPHTPHERAVEAAREDAARRSGLPPAQLKVVTLDSVTWRDGSLGCPRPDMAYTQALVPGYRVRLQVGTELWDYHASERGGLVLCPPERAQDPGPSGRD